MTFRVLTREAISFHKQDLTRFRRLTTTYSKSNNEAAAVLGGNKLRSVRVDPGEGSRIERSQRTSLRSRSFLVRVIESSQLLGKQSRSQPVRPLLLPAYYSLGRVPSGSFPGLFEAGPEGCFVVSGRPRGQRRRRFPSWLPASEATRTIDLVTPSYVCLEPVKGACSIELLAGW